MKFLTGDLTCLDCRQLWRGTWNLRVPAIICHECGSAQVIPIGLQIPSGALFGRDRTDAVLFALETRQLERTRS